MYVSNVWIHVSVFTFVGTCVYVCAVFVCMNMCVSELVQQVDVDVKCFLNLLHLIFWTGFSSWTQSLLASLDKILFVSASSSVLELQASNWHASQAFVWELDIWTEILMFAWQALYPVKYFSQLSICYLFFKSL